ncbi:ATP-binding protein [Litorimonas sp. WD9-15]|uniref:ATP-binding protein n=1 Tax=Litorimonas sp. WD9-15 TaxID=3418716 RepID=UPI003CFC6294
MNSHVEATQKAEAGLISLDVMQKLQFEWLARLSRMSGLASMIINSDMEIIYYEDRILDMLEFDHGVDLTGTSLLGVVSELAVRGDFGPGDKQIFCDLVRAEINRVPSEGEVKPKTLSLITPKGRRLLFRQDLDLDGIYLLTCKDITSDHIKRHALKVALDSSVSGYMIYNLETEKFEIHGEAGRRALGDVLTRRLMDKGIESILHPKDIEKVRDTWAKGLASKESWTSTFRVIDPEGQVRWIRSQATPQLSESGRVNMVIFFYTEVTSQLRIQDELRQSKEVAEKALSAKNNFLGRLSHEIRTPMNAVVGIADALIHHNGDPKIMPKLELIQTSAEKIVKIVDESLQHTKLSEAKMELDPVSASPREVVEAACALWEQQAIKTEVDLNCRIDPSVPDTIIFDPHRYEQCINNLLSNALKFSPGGTVNVILTTIGEGPNRKLVLAVKDNGIGMNEAQLNGLFEAFTQADKSISGKFGGTGLGMNITKQIIELMGGNVSAKSTSGEGTVVAMTLPIQEERRVEDRRESTQTLVSDMLDSAVPPKSGYENLRVLVVDDNATNHMVVCSLLDTLVASIEVAENGIEAIAKLNAAEFDVVLMDIHMPIMDGIEATLAIRSNPSAYSDIAIIALTADPQYQQKRLCKNIGMNDALAKPIKLTELLAAFDRLALKQSSIEIAA